MADRNTCVICGAVDSWKHALLDCNYARCVWALEREETVESICTIQHKDARGWLAEVLSTLPQEELIRVVVTLWAIWYARRKVVYENSFQSPLSTHSFIDRYVADLDMAVPQQEKKELRKSVSLRWIPPPSGVAKINVDAAISKNMRLGSVVAVARDSAGKFLGASSLVVEGTTEPEVMEAMACREGMALASDLLLQRVRMASDCNNVVRSFNEGMMGPYGHVIMDIRARQGDLYHFELVHESRRSNFEAHGLARSSLYASLGRHIWLLHPPEGICTIYASAEL
ncbi:unnamed protein product [Urochloa humidicola]